MIVYPRNEQLRPAREIVVVEDAICGTRDAKGFIPGIDPAKAQKNDQTFSMFNGRLDNDAVRVNAGDLVRMYFVNVGPGVSAAHTIGSLLDRVVDGKTPTYGVQIYAMPAGAGLCSSFASLRLGSFHSSIMTSWPAFRYGRYSGRGALTSRSSLDLTSASMRWMSRNRPAHAMKIKPEMIAAGRIGSEWPARYDSSVAVSSHI